MKAGATLSGVWAQGNTQISEITRGDITKGFAASDVIVQDTISCERWQHFESEEHAALAYWIGDVLYLWTSSQNPYAQRNDVAARLGIPQNKVHLVTHGSGAGEGNKHDCPYGAIAAVLAKKTGMPVLYQKSRREHMLTSARQHWGRADVKIGVKNDGTFQAMDCTFYGDCGGNGSAWAGGLSYLIRATWKCPNGHFKHVDIATNTSPTGAFRCVADPPGNLFMNQVIDMVAAKLNMDPLALKLKNVVTADMVHQDTNQPYASIAVKEMIQKAADTIGWSNKWHAPGTKTMADGRLHGIGLAAGSDSHGTNAMAWGMMTGATIIITNDGKAFINAGQSHCAGAINAMAAIVAETLGMSYDNVEIGDWGNTSVCLDGGMEGGSTRTITEGAAFQMAAQDALSQVFTYAATLLKTTADKLSAGGGKIYETANPTNSKTWAEVGAALPTPIAGRGYTWPVTLRRKVLNWPVGTPCLTQGAEATAVEIAVDQDTGEIEILDMVNVIDAGKAIHLSSVIKQINGGMEIQIGEALYFYQVLEKTTGVTLNPCFIDHKLPTSLDIYQDRLTPIVYESDDANGPYGAHGIGEPCVNAYCCLNAAFYNATGKWIKDSPMTPWKVLAALGKV
jgi:CO/xanthine dehydrogenase Mo-binding subunit